MQLEKLLSQNKASVLERWFNLIAETHSAEFSAFLKGKDRFTNPVGYTISQEINALYEELLQGRVDSEEVYASLDNIIKIRAVQDFTPPQAIAFVFLLKKAIREELASEITERQAFEELLKFESRIDRIVLLTLDIYMKCREKVYQVRVNEAKNEKERALKLLERISPIYGNPAKEQCLNNRII